MTKPRSMFSLVSALLPVLFAFCALMFPTAQPAYANEGGPSGSSANPGDTTAESALTTQSIATLPQSALSGNGKKAVQVVSRGFHTAALLDDGSVWEWSDSHEPKKKFDHAVQVAATNDWYAAIKDDASVWSWKRGEAATKVLNGAVQIDGAMFTYFAAVKSDGTLWCWQEGSSSPTKVMSGVSQAQVRSYYQSAAVKKNGELWFWDASDPANTGAQTKVMNNVKQVSLDVWPQFCACVRSDNSLWTWSISGWGNGRLLGDGGARGESEYKTPRKIMDNVACADIFGSGSAVKRDGSLCAWGSNYNGEVGDGTTAERTSPTKVLDNVVQATSSSLPYNMNFTSFSVAVKSDGTIWSWGGNGKGQLGDGTKEDRHAPVCIFRNGVWLGYESTGPKLFTLGRDNNSFGNSDSSFFDTARICRAPYFHLSDKYYKLLVSDANDGEKNAIKRAMDSEWEGSCYGIATTMALVFAGHLKPSNISDDGIKTYYSMRKPALNPKLINSIQYYQLSQYLSKGGRDDATVAKCSRSDFVGGLKNWLGTGGAMHDFLKELVRQTSIYGGNPVVLCYNYRREGENHGHAILATGCSYRDGKYTVKLYDENDREKFKYMTIPKNFSSFSFIDGNKNVITQNRYIDMRLLDLEKLKGVNDSTGLSTMSAPATGANVTIELAADSAVKLVDGKGNTLSYDGKSLSGNMPVYSASYSSSDSPVLSVEAAASGTITATRKSGVLDVAVISKKNLVSAKGKGIKSAVLKLGKGVKLKGSKFAFESFVSTGKNVSAGDPGLISISGNAKSNVKITTANGKVAAKSSRKMSGMETVSYIKSKAYPQSVAKPTKKVTRKASSKKVVLRKGAKFDSTFLKFRITKATGARTAQVIGLTPKGKKTSKLTVPSKVYYKGFAFKVSSVKASAFNKASKAKSAVIGANVSSIGKSAFKGCKKLTTVTVKSKKLTKKSVKKCLQGSKVSKIKVAVGKKAVNKSYAKKYKPFFTKKNAGKVAKVTT